MRLNRDYNRTAVLSWAAARLGDSDDDPGSVFQKEGFINSGRAKYAWVTILPLAFVSTTTLVAGFKSITDIFWPLAQKPETSMQGLINTSLTVIIMVAAVIIMLIWLWLAAIALLLGAEINSETVRSRELRAGRPAERELQVATRSG